MNVRNEEKIGVIESYERVIQKETIYKVKVLLNSSPGELIEVLKKLPKDVTLDMVEGDDIDNENYGILTFIKQENY